MLMRISISIIPEMLVRLTISDFALLQRAEVEFGAGLSAVTGETGAGKSLLVGALSFLAGQKAPFGLVRDGAKLAVVEGEFRRGQENVVTVIRRTLAADGRARAFIDDAPASQRELTCAAASLLDITSQRAFSRLLDPARHQDLLDAYAGVEEERRRLGQFAADHAGLDRRIRKLRNRLEDFKRRRDFARFELGEIDSVAPQAGENEELAAELRRLEHFEELHQDGARVTLLLTGESDAAEIRLAEASRLLERIGALDPALGELAGEIVSARAAVREISRRVAERCRRGGYEADRLEALRERQHRLGGLIRRFGGSLAAVLERGAALRRELSEGSGAEEELVGLEDQRGRVTKGWVALAAEVANRRREAAASLEEAVAANLRRLGVGEPRFIVRLVRTPDKDGLFEADGGRWTLTARGAEEAEFCLSANPGVSPRPVAAVASGGELSRLMLALKEALPLQSDEASLVFDEIDSGVSGRIARLVGRKLRQIAAGRQVVVITHLPQIASLADRHLKVVKREEGGVTTTHVVELTGDDRIRELAAMLSGGTITDAALEQARQLLVDE